MPRLRQVPKSEASEPALAAYQRMFGDRDPVAEPGTSTGTPGNWWTVMALSPDVLTYFQRGGGLMVGERRANTRYNVELALTRTGFAAGSQFVFSQHCKGARAAGISEEKIAAIPHWSAAAELFSAEERAILAYVTNWCSPTAASRTAPSTS